MLAKAVAMADMDVAVIVYLAVASTRPMGFAKKPIEPLSLLDPSSCLQRRFSNPIIPLMQSKLIVGNEEKHCSDLTCLFIKIIWDI